MQWDLLHSLHGESQPLASSQQLGGHKEKTWFLGASSFLMRKSSCARAPGRGKNITDATLRPTNLPPISCLPEASLCPKPFLTTPLSVHDPVHDPVHESMTLRQGLRLDWGFPGTELQLPQRLSLTRPVGALPAPGHPVNAKADGRLTKEQGARSK